jgi:hypothetical protein
MMCNKVKMLAVLFIVYIDGTLPKMFIELAYQGKDIVFRFIIEYSSLRDFGP